MDMSIPTPNVCAKTESNGSEASLAAGDVPWPGSSTEALSMAEEDSEGLPGAASMTVPGARDRGAVVDTDRDDDEGEDRPKQG